MRCQDRWKRIVDVAVGVVGSAKEAVGYGVRAEFEI